MTTNQCNNYSILLFFIFLKSITKTALNRKTNINEPTNDEIIFHPWLNSKLSINIFIDHINIGMIKNKETEDNNKNFDLSIIK